MQEYFFNLLSLFPFVVLPAYTFFRFYKAEYISFFRAFRLGVYTALMSCLSGVLGIALLHLAQCGIFGNQGNCDDSGASGWFAVPYILAAIPAGILVLLTKLIQEFRRKKSENNLVR